MRPISRRPNLLGHISDAIARNGVIAEQITFELTETALTDNFTAARMFDEGLTGLGCHLALDDFGTGYTSFAYLKHLPVDLVKIDGEFIRGLAHSAADQEIVRSIVRLCQALGVRTAAEYVENEETLTLLRRYGVDFAQGFHIARPQPVAARRHRAPSVHLDLQMADGEWSGPDEGEDAGRYRRAAG